MSMPSLPPSFSLPSHSPSPTLVGRDGAFSGSSLPSPLGMVHISCLQYLLRTWSPLLVTMNNFQSSQSQTLSYILTCALLGTVHVTLIVANMGYPFLAHCGRHRSMPPPSCPRTSEPAALFSPLKGGRKKGHLRGLRPAFPGLCSRLMDWGS